MRRPFPLRLVLALAFTALAAAPRPARAAGCEPARPHDPYLGDVNLFTGNVLARLGELRVAGVPVAFYFDECATQGTVAVPIRGVSTTLDEELLPAFDGTIRLLTPLGEHVYVEARLPDGSAGFVTQPDDDSFLRYDGLPGAGNWVLHASRPEVRSVFARVGGRYFITRIERDEGPGDAPLRRVIAVEREPERGAVSRVWAAHTGEELRFTRDAAGVHVTHRRTSGLAPDGSVDLGRGPAGELASVSSPGANGPVTNTFAYGDAGLLHSVDYPASRARTYFLRGAGDHRVVTVGTVGLTAGGAVPAGETTLRYGASPRSATYFAFPETAAQARTVVFDADHRTTEIRMSNAVLRRLTYDGAGRVARMESPLFGHGVDYVYGPRDQVAKVTRTDGRTLYQVFTWEDGSGLPTYLRPYGDDDGAQTFVAYDALGRVSEVMLPDGTTRAHTMRVDPGAPPGPSGEAGMTACLASTASAARSCTTYDGAGFLVGESEETSGDPAAARDTALVRTPDHAIAALTRRIGGQVVESASYGDFDPFGMPRSATQQTAGQPPTAFAFTYRPDGTMVTANNVTDGRRVELDVDDAGLPLEYRYYEPAAVPPPFPGFGKKLGDLLLGAVGDGVEVPLVRRTYTQRVACEGPASEALNGNPVWRQGGDGPSPLPPSAPCSACAHPPPPAGQPGIPGGSSGGNPLPGGAQPPPAGGMTPAGGGGWHFNGPPAGGGFRWPILPPGVPPPFFFQDGGPSILPGEGGGYTRDDVPDIYPDGENGPRRVIFVPGQNQNRPDTCLEDDVCVFVGEGRACSDGSDPITLDACLGTPGGGARRTTCFVDGVCRGGQEGGVCPGNVPATTLAECLRAAPPGTPALAYCLTPEKTCRFVGTHGTCSGGPLMTFAGCQTAAGQPGRPDGGTEAGPATDAGAEAGAEAGGVRDCGEEGEKGDRLGTGGRCIRGERK